MTRRARNEQRCRKRQYKAGHGCGERHCKRSQQYREIQRIEQALVTLKGPGLGSAAIRSTTQETVVEHNRERGQKEDHHPQPGWKQEPSPQRHEKTISSALSQQTWTASPAWNRAPLRGTCATTDPPSWSRIATSR